MESGTIHKALVRDVLGPAPSKDNSLCVMIVLHTHRVFLRFPVLDDRPGVAELAAITQRHAAEVLAATWPDASDARRTDPTYWFYIFNARTPFEVVEDIPTEWRERVQEIRARFVQNPVVERLEPED